MALSSRPVPTLVAFLAALVLSGCVSETTPSGADGEVTVEDPLRADSVTDENLLWLPAFSDLPDLGVAARELNLRLAKEHHNRISFTPLNDATVGFLVAELEGAGYTVEVLAYQPDAAPVDTNPINYHTIVGTRVGSVEPERHIGLVAHYDARYNSNEAAYDDGSGVAAVVELARHFATVETRKSITVLLFDGEELGLKSSCYYVEDIVASGKNPYDVVFGYDMVGMNWPGHDWKLYQMTGPKEDVDVLVDIASHVARDTYDLPADGFEILPEHDRNSDERRFREAGIPIYRWAGGRTAGEYPHYHEPTDTYENMIAFAGSEANFEAGMAMVLKTSIAMVHAVDQWDFVPRELTAPACSFVGDDEGPI